VPSRASRCTAAPSSHRHTGRRSVWCSREVNGDGDGVAGCTAAVRDCDEALRRHTVGLVHMPCTRRMDTRTGCRGCAPTACAIVHASTIAREFFKA
jgi:hypothetical protein